MSVFKWTATEEIPPGFNSGELLDLELRLVSRPLTVRTRAQRNTAIGGEVESILYRREKAYTAQSGLIEPDSLEDQKVQCLFASCSNAEPFTFDRLGTLLLPDNPVLCILESTSMAEIETGKKFYRYRLTLREA